ncbi:IclR family transcriptional regulator [Nonomuraea sp. NPDC050478]|uniref:IclR family transcriptional regulator n=1 Tax=Nonomuraea sp. NPDC050478 TaxID=3364365 RepID=UPI0037BA5E24
MTPLNAGAEPPPSMVERMTLIMDAFAGRAALLTLEDVARRTRLPRSTAHRILDQLVRLDWLEHTSSGYRLGRRALGLGGDGGHGRIREAAAPLLHELQLSTGLVVHLAVLDGADVRFLDKAGGPFARSVPSRVGGRAPAHATALGRAILAWLEPERVEALIGDPGSLHQELHRVRQRRGLAFERGDCFPGIASVAAAIRGPEGPVAGISLAGDSRAPLERVAPLVRDAARQASRALFPEPEPLRHAARVPHRGRLPGPIDRLLTAGRGDRS